tara:strand:+ start:1439 stop:2344 length:906 start_codon:yes stop_codon:yes gene_type:complete
MRRIFIAGIAALGLILGWSSTASAQGCSIGSAGATQIVAAGQDGRQVRLHRPAGSHSGALPLVFVLHGSGSTGEAVLRDSKLEALADREGFLLAAPDGAIALGSGYAWNIPGVPTTEGKVPGADVPSDTAYVLSIIDRLVSAGCADPARVYVTGISGGGRMTSWLGCVAADRFAAIAPVVGLRAGNPLESDPRRPDPETCKPSAPVSVLAFAGDADTVNPVAGGGAGYWQYSMDAALARWAELDGCDSPPARINFTDKVLVTSYTGCKDGVSVAGWIYHGLGHIWLADNDAMWRFFARHHR